MDTGLKRAKAHAEAIRKEGPLSPAATILVKLGSIAVHADEMMSSDGHAFDQVALKQLLADHEVMAWLAQMDDLAFLPKRRLRGG